MKEDKPNIYALKWREGKTMLGLQAIIGLIILVLFVVGVIVLASAERRRGLGCGSIILVIILLAITSNHISNTYTPLSFSSGWERVVVLEVNQEDNRVVIRNESRVTTVTTDYFKSEIGFDPVVGMKFVKTKDEDWVEIK